MARVENGVETLQTVSTGSVGCPKVGDDKRWIYNDIYPNVT